MFNVTVTRFEDKKTFFINLLLENKVFKCFSSNKEDKNTLFDNENHVYVVLDALPGLTLIGYVFFFEHSLLS
jgi:hypothetical protein